MSNLVTLDHLHNDAQLDSDIQYPHALSQYWDKPKAIFLTGATGFLGTYLLFELLQQTQANIYCLVRAEDTPAAMQRLQKQLSFYQLWQASFQQRIIPIVGDLSQANFALSKHAFTELATSIDVIYHNGAQVNAMYNYSRLKASNVDGTKTILRLAGLKQTKPVHFISTLAVFFTDKNQNKTILENEVPKLDQSMKGGYKQTKWVAETLIHAAKQRGLVANIYRPGRIWGDSQTAIMDQFSDLLLNFIQAGIHLKTYPDLANIQVNIAPVDYVSRAIVALGQQVNKDHLSIFHLNNPHSIYWNTLWELIKNQGYSINKVDFIQWKKYIYQGSKQKIKKRVYLTLHHLLRSPIYIFSQKPEFDTQITVEKLQHTEISCPIFDKQLLENYLYAFQKQGYIASLLRKEENHISS